MRKETAAATCAAVVDTVPPIEVDQAAARREIKESMNCRRYKPTKSRPKRLAE